LLEKRSMMSSVGVRVFQFAIVVVRGGNDVVEVESILDAVWFEKKLIFVFFFFVSFD